MTKIRFRNPPINELVIGAYFEREIPTFGLEHVGLFWSIIRNEFPRVNQQPILTPPPLLQSTDQPIELTIEQFPMPRFWFEATDGITLIQLQKNAFIFNWRKRDADYPHFEAVKAAFDKYLSIFVEFVTKEVQTVPNLRVLELSYINNFFPSDYWRGPRDTSVVLPFFRLPIVDDENRPPPDFNQASVQRLAPDLMLSTIIRTARSAKDATQPVLIFELRAVGVLDEATKRDVDSWFERAHEKIGACFLSMTSPDIRNRYWQPV
jgi:uncharacterized protein (TIGR04255 family)